MFSVREISFFVHIVPLIQVTCPNQNGDNTKSIIGIGLINS